MPTGEGLGRRSTPILAVILPKRVLEIPLKKLFEETWWSAVVVVDTEVLVVAVDTEVLVGVEKNNRLPDRSPLSVDEKD